MKLGEWGGSTAVRLPKTVLNQGNLTSGDEVEIYFRDGEVIIRPSKIIKHYSTSELLKGYKFQRDPCPELQSEDTRGAELC